MEMFNLISRALPISEILNFQIPSITKMAKTAASERRKKNSSKTSKRKRGNYFFRYCSPRARRARDWLVNDFIGCLLVFLIGYLRSFEFSNLLCQYGAE